MIIGIIQARTGSSRFPEKIFAEVQGKPLLELYVKRVQGARTLDEVIVATTDLDEDDRIERLCGEIGATCFRGSENDLLDRFYKCALNYQPSAVVRLTSDDAFVDYQVIDRAVGIWNESKADFVNNHFTPTYPEGLDTEVYGFSALERSFKKAKLASEREHVFPYIENHQDQFNVITFTQNEDLSHLRWTVDYPCDLEMVRQVYSHLYSERPIFLQEDIVALLREYPAIAEMNAHIKRKEGVNKTKSEDSVVAE